MYKFHKLQISINNAVEDYVTSPQSILSDVLFHFHFFYYYEIRLPESYALVP